MASKKESKRKTKDIGGDVLKARLLQDDAFRKYKQILKSMKEKHDLEDLLNEATTMHNGRLSRTLKGTNPGPQKIADAALQDGSHRGRLSAMYATLIRQRDLLEIAVNAAKIHITAQYGEDIPGFRTKGERSAYLDHYVSGGVKFLANIDSILKVLETYIKDIDNMHFQLKLAFQTLSLVYDKNKEMG